MSREDFKQIYEELTDKDVIPFLVARYLKYPYSTFISIYSQKKMKDHMKWCKVNIPNIGAHYQSYKNGRSLVEISASIDRSPSILANQVIVYLLDNDLKTLCGVDTVINNNTDIGKLMAEVKDKRTIAKKIYKHPDMIQNERLRFNIQQTHYGDGNVSPLINYIRSSTGAEYEFLLQEKLYQLSIPYKTEDQLRKIGYPKTPDIKLDIPFAYKGHIVNWIESKASFCDDNNYCKVKEQIVGYKNRYGPGIVIFWFGYIDDLNNLTNDGILISNIFPDIADIELISDFKQHLSSTSSTTQTATTTS
ncbi:hypothetical protein SAMD00019534_042090 [Acytostelium subglobosum LB1]|uniref:hypothetical protein n=1 Tax=Acytostelium subglobosum LB1 TaxID=1410327 RepID=UPI000644DB7C|nr:hypothetical protein SAMD00019534_042090 [Acytostelium subglobosum LB1]GAM21034.1 hypothetical protein SAMD00019534_042090 [Acytostelium subglobosum LB1]|eukprot:XP_012756168.1 hypothetical protein SAMD00019534_042090 [Acytostelium subglobosum LB1]